MRIHKEGIPTITITTIVVALIILASVFYLFPYHPLLAWILGLAAFGLLIFIVSFFRIPNRIYAEDNNLIMAPCDGKVVVIEEVQPDEYFKDKHIQVSIFMSPLNVHVNRNPVTGSVVYSKYHPGKYLVAWHPKSSIENERHSVVNS